MRRVGLFGGTFDPIHQAHLLVAEEVREALGLDRMVFIPAGDPPHKSGRVRTPVAQRVAMVELAIASNPHFSLSRIEVDRPGRSYLVDTLRLLKELWGVETQLYFVIGGDSLHEFHTWYDARGILSYLTGLVSVHRPGYVEDSEYNKQLEASLPGITERLHMVQTPLLDISSTDIRHRVAEDKTIKYRVPEAVEQYIYTHGLYRV